MKLGGGFGIGFFCGLRFALLNAVGLVAARGFFLPVSPVFQLSFRPLIFGNRRSTRRRPLEWPIQYLVAAARS